MVQSVLYSYYPAIYSKRTKIGHTLILRPLNMENWDSVSTHSTYYCRMMHKHHISTEQPILKFKAVIQFFRLQVCLTPSPLTDETMQKIAMEMNQAETAFLTRAGETGGDALIRWFTPTTEVWRPDI